MKYMSKHRILNPNQLGFRPRLSCETQLVEFIADLSTERDKWNKINAVLLDFSKAFVEVNHKLIQKMFYIGVSEQILNWTELFLSRHTHQLARGFYLNTVCYSLWSSKKVQSLVHACFLSTPTTFQIWHTLPFACLLMTLWFTQPQTGNNSFKKTWNN